MNKEQNKRKRVEEKKEKKKLKEKRKKEEAALGDAAPPKQIPRTLDNTREFDETIVQPNDEEVLEDERTDEFADYFKGLPPKVMITTSKDASKPCLEFVTLLLQIFPNIHFYKRREFDLQDIVKFANNKEFTDLIVINENRKKPNALLLVHLPEGPTAHFKLSSFVAPEDIPGHGKTTDHRPELILNNFNTRLGHTIGRMLASLFPQDPNFRGRRVVTFHNQRDFIFFRHHRYIFEGATPKQAKARLQECGPRFCLKLKSLQHGTFDTNGEYEWVHKTDMDTSRRRFFL